MKSFIIKLTLFFFIVIAIDFTIGYFMNYLYTNTIKGDYGRNNYICTQANQDCLIFGSSRAIHHYNPDTIGNAINMSCYNCGEDGMGIITMYGRYQMIRQRHVPKVIIYDVVSSFDLGIDDKTKYIGWLRFYDNNHKIAQLINMVDNKEKYKSFSKSYKYNSRFLDIISQHFSNVSTTAADYKFAPLYGTINYEVTPPKENNCFKIDNLKLYLFEEMIKQCKKDKTQFIVVLSPWYKNTYDKDYESIFLLCNKYEIKVLNYIKDDNINFNPKLFKDASHLNTDGVKIFNEKICKELKKNRFFN